MQLVMESKDKIYKQFKTAAKNKEKEGFDRMEAVWNRVEEKLDQKEKRRAIAWWKYTSIAALLLLFISIGNWLINNNQNTIITPDTLPENNVTIIDTQKIKETFTPSLERIVEEEVAMENAPLPRGNQYTTSDSVRFKGNDNVQPPMALPFAFFPTSEDIEPNNNLNHSNSATINSNVTTQYPAITSNRYPINGDYKNTIQQSEDKADGTNVQLLHRRLITTGTEKPDKATLHQNVEPLFVINGTPTNEDTFRKMNHKEITSYSILKDTEATSLYGSRGSNGVIIITTKKDDLDLDGYIDHQSIDEINIELNRINAIPSNQKTLYIIDGFPVDEVTFRNINPEHIANCRVLKDANATTIYGNGSDNVVLINTKKTFITEGTLETKKKIRIDQEDYEVFEENQFEDLTIAPLSTFSIDVDNASYTNIRRFINNEQTVPKSAVRIEEMINFFKYQYIRPNGSQPFSISTEYSYAPWNTKHKLLKIGLRGKDIPKRKLPASNLVFLIDVSGSMNNQNKLPLLKKSMKILTDQMRNKDRIAIVTYAGTAQIVLPSTSGAEKDKIIAVIDSLKSEGSTAGDAGIELAYKTAQENFIKDGNNRVILATDGDFNIGDSSDEDMQTLIEQKRKSGVYLTCLGYGMGNYKDSKLEILANKGSGNYAYIDNIQEADRFLQKEFKGSMYAIAKDVKIQIEFNPKYVQSYRLIGYENRKLRDEDFVNDAVDAGELGSGHTVTALYEIIPVGVNSNYFNAAPKLKYSPTKSVTGNYNNELATIKFRYKKPNEDVSKELTKVVQNVTTQSHNASSDFNFAAAVAWFGLKLRDSKLIPNKESDAIIELAKKGLRKDPEGYREEFIKLVDMIE